MRKLLLLLIVSFALFPQTVMAQKNEAYGYVQVGKSTIANWFGGFSGFYTRHLTDRVNVMGGLNLSTKNPQVFRGLLADGTYRFPVNRANLYLGARAVFNYYGESKAKEFLFRIAAKWETRYVEFVFGNSFLTYGSYGSYNFEPVTWCVGFAANLKPRENPWNVGLFIKNYDDFVYENWILNYGFKGYYDVAKEWRVTGEFQVHPAGSINQLATKYETLFKVGARYLW